VAAPDLYRSTNAADVTDAELVDRLRKGESSAFEALYERYFKRIYHFVDRRLSIRADAEETTQEVFLCVFSSIDSYRGDAPLAAWIFGITRRVIAARFKKKRHITVPLPDGDPEQLSPLVGQLSSEPSPLESYEYQERLLQMSDSLENRLSAEQRRLFELHHIQELPISEIALSLDKSENAIKSNLYRARKLLLAR